MQDKTSVKIDGKVHLVSSIDVSSYTTLHATNPANLSENIYDLYGVINHSGSVDTGHYTVYIKHREAWFLFDDHTVTEVSEDVVLFGDAYMCFYAQRWL
jgi:ubiquitin carboxyl-terminal hydrolase 22/27/51